MSIPIFSTADSKDQFICRFVSGSDVTRQRMWDRRLSPAVFGKSIPSGVYLQPPKTKKVTMGNYVFGAAELTVCE